MPQDVTLWDFAQGVQDTWAANAELVALLPASRVYLERVPANVTYPNCSFGFKDVSAYFGGTTYFSGSAYIKVTQIEFRVYGTRSTDFRAVARAIANAFGWSADLVEAQWSIPNATVLSAMPEVEGIEVIEERVSGEDLFKYTSSFTVTVQAERGW